MNIFCPEMLHTHTHTEDPKLQPLHSHTEEKGIGKRHGGGK